MVMYVETIEGIIEKTSDTEWDITVPEDKEELHDDIANLLLNCLEHLEKGKPRKYRITIEAI